MEQIKAKENLTSDKMRDMKIVRLLLSMSLPAIFSMFVLSLYNIVDSIFIAKFDPKALDALSIAFPMQQLIIAFAVGIGVGTNAYVARKLGQKKFEEATLSAQTGLFMALCASMLFLVLGLTVSRPFMSAFTDDAKTIGYGTTYLTVVTSLSIGSFVDIVCSRTLQATGNMRVPMISQLAGAVINIAFDPILIFACKLGVLGAAIATVMGQMCAMAIGLCAFKFKNQDVTVFFNRKFRLRAPIIKGILKISIPTMVMNTVAAFVTTILNLILKIYKSAITVLGIYFKLQSFVFMPVFGLTQGALPIMSYNFGARNRTRFMEAYKWSLVFALSIMALGLIIFQTMPNLLMRMFNADGALMQTGIFALRAISICFIFAAFGIISTSTIQALRYGALSMVISLLRQVVLLIPFAILFSHFFGVNGVWFAFPASEIIVAVFFGFIICPIINKKFPKNLVPSENSAEKTALAESNSADDGSVRTSVS